MHKAVQIDIKDNGLTVTMTILKSVLEKQRELTYPGLPDVLAACRECKINFGIDEDKIVKNLKFKDTPIIIAKGRPATPTIQDLLVYSFQDKRNKKFTPTILENNKADYYDFVKYKLAQPNEVLAFIRKGRTGENGMNVFGEEQFPDKYVEMSTEILKKVAGANTEYTEKGVISTIVGIPSIESNGKVNVQELCTIPRDVDFSTGSIDFEGSIIVKGNVKHNFRIKTPNDVIIEGLVEGGIIEAGGMITLLGGITSGKVTCGKILVAKYIYLSEVTCKTTVVVNEAIHNSTVTATTVIAKGTPGETKSGQISGGKVSASNFIWARTLGSETANYTNVHIISLVDKSQLKDLQKEKHKLTDDVDRFVRTLNTFEDLKTKVANLPPDYKKTHYSILQMLKSAELKLKKVQAHINITEKEILDEEKASERKVYVAHLLHPKVAINILNKTALSKNEYGPSLINLSEKSGNIQIEPFTGAMEIPKGFD